jgi:hypothetical protein
LWLYTTQNIAIPYVLYWFLIKIDRLNQQFWKKSIPLYHLFITQLTALFRESVINAYFEKLEDCIYQKYAFENSEKSIDPLFIPIE